MPAIKARDRAGTTLSSGSYKDDCGKVRLHFRRGLAKRPAREEKRIERLLDALPVRLKAGNCIEVAGRWLLADGRIGEARHHPGIIEVGDGLALSDAECAALLAR